MAADQGDPKAQNNLGVMYVTGRGVPRDYVEAAMWFQKAAAQGDTKAGESLARLETLLKTRKK